MINSISGFVSGLFATSVTHPFDLLKTKIQLEPKIYHNTYHAAIHVYKKNGLTGFFAGYVPRAVRKTLSSAITWVIYEEFVKRNISI